MRALLGLGALWLVATWGGTASARGSHPAVGLRIDCDDGARYGAAMLIADPRPTHAGGLLVLTALHVVQDCARLELIRLTCDREQSVLSSGWSADHPVDLLLFRSLDVAAIVVPEADQHALATSLRGGLKLPEQLLSKVQSGTKMRLAAAAGVNVCPDIPVTPRDLFKTLDLFKRLDSANWDALFGSLAGETQLISYQSTAVRGTSGGPVVSPRVDANKVVAVNLGGLDGILQWGVLVSRQLLLEQLKRGRERAYARLDAQHPRLHLDSFKQPQAFTKANLRDVARLDNALYRDSYQVALEVTTPIDPFGAYAISPQLGWSHLWFSPGFALLNTAIGSRILVGGIFGRYRSVMSGPGFQEQPRKGTARLPFAGAYAELDAELHLARLSPVHYVIAFGLRGGPVHQREMESGANKFVWGPALSGQLKWNWLERVAWTAQLRVSVDKIPVSACRPGCEGPSLERAPIWDAWGGASMGFEVRP